MDTSTKSSASRNARGLKLATTVAVTVACLGTAEAQDSADRIGERFEQRSEPKSVFRPDVPAGESTPETKSLVQEVFTLREISVTGSSVYDEADFADLIAPYLNKDIGLQDLQKLAGEITARYGNDGYPYSRAYIPPQDVTGGVGEIKVLEAFIDEVIIEGELRDEFKRFEYFAAQIKAMRPIHTPTLERYLLLAKDLAGVDVKSTLRASKTTQGASTLILQLDAQPELLGFLSIDNRGTNATGPIQITPGISVSNPFGYFSQTNLLVATTSTTKELRYFALSNSTPISNEGTTLESGATYSLSHPGTDALVALNQHSRSASVSLGIKHPSIRSQHKNLSFSAKLDLKNSDSYSAGAKVSGDRTRVFRAGVDFDYADAYSGVNQLSVEWSQGINGLGAISGDSALKSRADGAPEFNKMTFSASRTQLLKALHPDLEGWTLFAALEGQFAGNALLSSEECGIGGKDFGRAYDSSEITGEHCAALSLEARRSLDTSANEFFRSAQSYFFYDAGQAENKNPSAANPRRRSLASAGAGLRFTLPHASSFNVEFAKPLTRDVANKGNQDVRFFANFSIRF